MGDFHRDMETSLGAASAREAGWVLSPVHHGKGYATEAVRAALADTQRDVAEARTAPSSAAHTLLDLFRQRH